MIHPYSSSMEVYAKMMDKCNLKIVYKLVVGWSAKASFDNEKGW